MLIIINTIFITFLLYINIIMGNLAIEKDILTSVKLATDFKAMLFGMICSLVLVLLNKKYKTNFIFFISTISLLYVNFTMSRIIDFKSFDIFQDYFNYINEAIVFMSIASTIIIFFLHYREKPYIKFNYSFNNTFNSNYIIYYFLTNMILLMTNVVMETAYQSTLNKAKVMQFAQFDVALIGFLGISIIVFFQFLLTKKY